MKRWIITFIFSITCLNILPMADYKKLIPIVKKWEGGYAGNIDGKQCTHVGVTLETYRRAFGKDKTCNDLRKMTDEQWEFIFKKLYWDNCKADSINSQSIANLIVDWNWHSGTYGIKHTQRVLGVKDDGLIGPKTLEAINNHPYPKLLFIQLWQKREQYLRSLNKPQFIRGWMNRLNDFKYID